MREREPTSFWRENAGGVVGLLRVLSNQNVEMAKRSYQMLLLLFKGNKHANFCGKKKYNEAFSLGGEGLFLKNERET